MPTASTAITVNAVGALVAINQAGPNFGVSGPGVFTTTSLYMVIAQGSAPNYYAGLIGSPLVNNSGSNAVFGGVLQDLVYNSASAASATDVARIGQDRTIGGTFWPGWIGEVVAFSAQLSGPNATALYTNQKAYWSTP